MLRLRLQTTAIPSANRLCCIKRGDITRKPSPTARLQKPKRVKRVEQVERVTRYLQIDPAKGFWKGRDRKRSSSHEMMPKSFNVTGNGSSDDQSYYYKSKKKDSDNRNHRSQSEPPTHVKNARAAQRGNDDCVSVGRVGNIRIS